MNEQGFSGFQIPTKNFFSLPNEMIDIISQITNMAELKVIIYVIRHTWGFHEYGMTKTISTDEFMHGRKRRDGSRMDKGTGLSHHSVIDGLRAAVEHGYLICEIDTSDKARTVKSYALKMDEPDVKNLQRGEASEESSEGEGSAKSSEATSEESSEGPVKNLQRRSEESSDRSEKDTKERHLVEKDTKERHLYGGNEHIQKKGALKRRGVTPPPLLYSRENDEEEFYPGMNHHLHRQQQERERRRGELTHV